MSGAAISIIMVGRNKIRLRSQYKRYLRKDLRALLEGKKVQARRLQLWKHLGEVTGLVVVSVIGLHTGGSAPSTHQMLVSCIGVLLVMKCRCLLEGGWAPKPEKAVAMLPCWLQQNCPGLWQWKILPWIPCTEMQALIWRLTCHTLFYCNIK